MAETKVCKDSFLTSLQELKPLIKDTNVSSLITQLEILTKKRTDENDIASTFLLFNNDCYSSGSMHSDEYPYSRIFTIISKLKCDLITQSRSTFSPSLRATGGWFLPKKTTSSIIIKSTESLSNDLQINREKHDASIESKERAQCPAGIKCANFLEKHCLKFSHPIRKCPSGEDCDLTWQSHFNETTHT